MIANLYRKLFPLSFREFMYDHVIWDFLFLKKNFKLIIKTRSIYLFQQMLPKTEVNRLFAFMGKHGITPYPYSYALNYKKMDIDCRFDENKGLWFVMHENKKLYFFKRYRAKAVKYMYRSLLSEQDVKSAHRYVKSYDELQNATLMDIGSAEGLFALNVVDIVEHVYLFECDKEWIEALQATFEPWKEKVTIISLYVNDHDNKQNITIDSFLSDKQINKLFIKMDIEGFEQAALKGAANTLKNTSNIQCAISTYHKPDDASEIASIFEKMDFSYNLTDGYLFFENQFRKAIIRAYKY